MILSIFTKKVSVFFTTDSKIDLANLAKYAPGSKVWSRILTEGTGADWPFPENLVRIPLPIYHLIVKASKMNLQPWGISFHVGSQQRDIGQWDDAVARCKYLFRCVQLPKKELN